MLTHLSSADIPQKTAASLVELLLQNEKELKLENAVLQYDFPVFRDVGDDELVQVPVLIMSPRYGVIVFATTDSSQRTAEDVIRETDEQLEAAAFGITGLCIQNKYLRDRQHMTKVPITGAIYAPNVEAAHVKDAARSQILTSWTSVKNYFAFVHRQFMEIVKAEEIESSIFGELTSTIEGAKALFTPKKRDVSKLLENSKGKQANLVETELANFDRDQVKGYLRKINGPQRLRGLAGSGKTVVLAMKAALLHLTDPDAEIIYTFSTKSLYDHIQRLIRRFYEHFGGKQPNWDRLRIMHAWGGESMRGVYFDICQRHQLQSINYSRAGAMKAPQDDHFDFVCKRLLENLITPTYDYVLVDEGQDFPASFLKLCSKVAKGGKFVLAYDELQNIFQVEVPRPQDILGAGVEFSSDIVLHKCYRNPREILLCAHALGFGIYADKIVQMLENEDHWKDIGYDVVQGPLVEGQWVQIERPDRNSLLTISDRSGIKEIVKAFAFATPQEEVKFVAESIKADIDQGLYPHDILVICAADRNAKNYVQVLSKSLSQLGIASFSSLSSDFAGRNFQKEGFVTLATVAKAKGNESFMVYVVGTDAVFNFTSIRNRNAIFTSMTRAKGWIRLTGVGPYAQKCVEELEKAKEYYPKLEFSYPSPAQLRIMKRDLREALSPKEMAERQFESLIATLGESKARELLEQLTYEVKKQDTFEP